MRIRVEIDGNAVVEGEAWSLLVHHALFAHRLDPVLNPPVGSQVTITARVGQDEVTETFTVEAEFDDED